MSLRVSGKSLVTLFCALAMVWVAACGHRNRKREPTVALPGPWRAPTLPDCDAKEDPRCKNPVDRIVLAELKKAGLQAAKPDMPELCRRLAVDMLGRIPTGPELKSCLGRPIDATVDAWLASDAYVLNERRYWADLVDYSVDYSWYVLVDDLDALVTRYAKGQLGYGAFAGELVMHPAFYGRHPDLDWSRAMYSIFLGRAARIDEVVALAPLARVWATRALMLGPENKATSDGKSVTVTNYGQAYAEEVGFDPCGCAVTIGGCRSRALGKLVDFGSGECNKDCKPRAYGGFAKADGTPCLAEPVRLVGVSAGMPRKGADGKPSTWRERDLEGDDVAEPWPEASAEQKKRLHSLGDALVARPDFWEAAVDRELKRLLGWWQTSFQRAESDLPLLRHALAGELARTGDIRALRRAILTSVLYTMPASHGSTTTANALPPWSSGPRKLLTGQRWLDSAGIAIGETLGGCDHRFVTRNPYFDSAFADSATLAAYGPESRVEPGLATEVTPSFRENRAPFAYSLAARSLGGCGAHGSSSPTLGTAQSQRELATRLCAQGRAVLPPRFDGRDLDGAAAHLIARLLGREPTAPQKKALGDEMRQCVAAGPRGCDSPTAAVRWACVRLMTSAEFGTY